MSAGPMNRRRFLAACGVTALAGAGVAAWQLGDRGPRERLTRLVGEAYGGSDLEELGRAYLDDRGDEDDERRLVRILESRGGWREVAEAREIPLLVRRESRRDFAAGRIVLVKGWYLAETEARVCALATFA